VTVPYTIFLLFHKKQQAQLVSVSMLEIESLSTTFAMIGCRYIIGLLLLGSSLLLEPAVAQNCTTYCGVNIDECRGAPANEYANYMNDDMDYDMDFSDDSYFGTSSSSGSTYYPGTSSAGSSYPRIPCDSASINPHGMYTSQLAPCMFTFHTIAVNDNVTYSDGLEMSTLCSDNNRVGHIAQDYVFNWGDECVRDFARCYSLERDADIYMSFVCSKKWALPVGTTHISVNCTRDNEMVNKQKNNFHEDSSTVRDDNNVELMKEDWRGMQEFEIFAIVFSVLVFVFCLGCCYMGHCLFFSPSYHTSTLVGRRRLSESGGLVPAVMPAFREEVV
jgi:hypothetical protein